MSECVYVSALLEEDKKLLKSVERSLFQSPILQPIINAFAKNIRESVPGLKIHRRKKISADDLEEDALNQKVDQIFTTNDLERKTGIVGMHASVGGFGVFKLDTDYVDNVSMEQDFYTQSRS